MGGVGAVALVGCGTEFTSSGSASSSSSTPSSSGSASSGFGQGGIGDGEGPRPGADMNGSQEGLDEGDIPEETNGPYPADNTNGINVLKESGIVRRDIRSSFADASGVAEENYLRGVQEVAADGSCTFTSIFPGCYSGRWPHLHFEVYGSLEDATSASNKVRTSQIAFPKDVCQNVYDNADGYSSSQDTFARISLETDGIFSDGYKLEMAKLTGSIDQGYTLRLNVPV